MPGSMVAGDWNAAPCWVFGKTAFYLLKGVHPWQVLQKEISRARMQMIEPFIRGPAGATYLQREFANRHGAPSGAATTLTRTAQWISSTRESLSEWKEHSDMATAATQVSASSFIAGGRRLSTKATCLS